MNDEKTQHSREKADDTVKLIPKANTLRANYDVTHTRLTHSYYFSLTGRPINLIYSGYRIKRPLYRVTVGTVGPEVWVSATLPIAGSD